jgi:CBS domain-containing protein
MKPDDFKAIPPFDQLSDAQRQHLSTSVDIVYLAQGQTRLINSLHEDNRYLLIPFKGRGQWQTSDTETDVIHALEVAGALVLLDGGEGTFTALDEVLAYRLPAIIFNQLCQESPTFKAHWTASLQDKRLALNEQNQANSLSDFMMAQTQDAWLCPIITLAADTSLREAAQALRASQCTAALVELSEQHKAIVTTNDLLNAFTDYEASDYPKLSDIASPNPIAIDAQDYLFNALLAMTEHNISHLLVTQKQQPIGILQQKTLLAVFANQSVLIAQQIERASSIEELIKSNDTLTLLIRTLHTKGVKPRLIGDLVSTLNRRLFRKIAALTQPTGYSPDFALLSLGSEGRQEQILRTDQDNALIWADDTPSDIMQQWAQAIHDALTQLGFPDCPGNIMITNDLWRQPLESMLDTARHWIYQPSSDGMMHLSILLDADTAAGNAELTQQLLSRVRAMINDNRQFLAQFAKSALQFDTPLGIFAQFVTEKDNKHRLLDLKKGGIFPIVHGVRVLACEQQITAQSTHQRLIALGETKLMEASFASELTEALDFMQQLRLNSQLAALSLEHSIDNRIEPELLNHLQRDMLKDAFKLVDQFKALLSHHYKLHLIS